MLSSLFLDIILGSSNLPVSELWHALAHPFSRDTSVHVIVWEIRLPYALMALLVGMTLGLAGAEMQTILNIHWQVPLHLESLLRQHLVQLWRLY